MLMSGITTECFKKFEKALERVATGVYAIERLFVEIFAAITLPVFSALVINGRQYDEDCQTDKGPSKFLQ